ncbi:hypothetical protein AB0K18_35885 [Nonomuraea sp. NPDC049421]
MNEPRVEPDRPMADERLISVLLDRACSEGLPPAGEGGLLRSG